MAANQKYVGKVSDIRYGLNTDNMTRSRDEDKSQTRLSKNDIKRQGFEKNISISIDSLFGSQFLVYSLDRIYFYKLFRF